MKAKLITLLLILLLPLTSNAWFPSPGGSGGTTISANACAGGTVATGISIDGTLTCAVPAGVNTTYDANSDSIVDADKVATLNQNTTGSAESIKSPSTTGLATVTGMGAGTTRVKTVRDVNDTILELGGSYTPTGTWTFNTDVMIDAGLGNSPAINFVDGTDEIAEIKKTDSGYLTISTPAADGVNIVGGSLKIGNGAPGQTINGEDLYVEGLVEVDGMIYADGGVTGDVTGALTGNADTATALTTLGTANQLYGMDSAGTAGEWKSTVNIQLKDDAAQFANATDSTKTMQIELGSITTGTKRTLTVQDKDGTIAVVSNEKLAVFAWDGGASAMTTGATTKRCTIFPGAATIVGVYAIGDVSTTTHIHVYQDAFAAGARSTTVTAAVDIGATLGSVDTTLTGWDKSITAADEICMSVEANNNAKWLTVIVYGTR